MSGFLQISEATWETTIHTINSIFADAEKVCFATILETLLGCATCYCSRLVSDTIYQKKMKKLNEFLAQENHQTYNPAGFHILSPMERGLRTVEIWILSDPSLDNSTNIIRSDTAWHPPTALRLDCRPVMLYELIQVGNGLMLPATWGSLLNRGVWFGCFSSTSIRHERISLLSPLFAQFCSFSVHCVWSGDLPSKECWLVALPVCLPRIDRQSWFSHCENVMMQIAFSDCSLVFSFLYLCSECCHLVQILNCVDDFSSSMGGSRSLESLAKCFQS